ncbi:hypothetical protein AX16_004356 [Volvariella volvacea WC 439]|nr:hypothetical protein AX16_004356 [Volvariella volvacea WC 439]
MPPLTRKGGSLIASMPSGKTDLLPISDVTYIKDFIFTATLATDTSNIKPSTSSLSSPSQATLERRSSRNRLKSPKSKPNLTLHLQPKSPSLTNQHQPVLSPPIKSPTPKTPRTARGLRRSRSFLDTPIASRLKSMFDMTEAPSENKTGNPPQSPTFSGRSSNGLAQPARPHSSHAHSISLYDILLPSPKLAPFSPPLMDFAPQRRSTSSPDEPTNIDSPSPSPTSTIFHELEDQRTRKRLEKLRRTLGERVPAEVVLPKGTKPLYGLSLSSSSVSIPSSSSTTTLNGSAKNLSTFLDRSKESHSSRPSMESKPRPEAKKKHGRRASIILSALLPRDHCSKEAPQDIERARSPISQTKSVPASLSVPTPEPKPSRRQLNYLGLTLSDTTLPTTVNSRSIPSSHRRVSTQGQISPIVFSAPTTPTTRAFSMIVDPGHRHGTDRYGTTSPIAVIDDDCPTPRACSPASTMSTTSFYSLTTPDSKPQEPERQFSPSSDVLDISASFSPPNYSTDLLHPQTDAPVDDNQAQRPSLHRSQSLRLSQTLLPPEPGSPRLHRSPSAVSTRRGKWHPEAAWIAKPEAPFVKSVIPIPAPMFSTSIPSSRLSSDDIDTAKDREFDRTRGSGRRAGGGRASGEGGRLGDVKRGIEIRVDKQTNGDKPVEKKKDAVVTRREKRQGWSGEWNRADMQDVIKKLRNLK